MRTSVLTTLRPVLKPHKLAPIRLFKFRMSSSLPNVKPTTLGKSEVYDEQPIKEGKWIGVQELKVGVWPLAPAHSLFFFTSSPTLARVPHTDLTPPRNNLTTWPSPHRPFSIPHSGATRMARTASGKLQSVRLQAQAVSMVSLPLLHPLPPLTLC